MQILKNQIVAITTGEYSDYCLRDHLRALKDFDTAAEISRFKKQDTAIVDDYGDQDRFLAWAIREGLMSPLDDASVVEFWIGAYGDVVCG